jgi:hypothetical protein
MAKRHPGAERYVFTPNTYIHDGQPYEIETNKAIPNTIFLYWGDFSFVQGALYDALWENPDLKSSLENALTVADIKAALHDLDTGRISADSARINRSIARLSDEDLRRIVNYLVSPSYVFPATVSQWTFPEARATGFAIAQPPRIRPESWKSLENGFALQYVRPDDPLEVKFDPSRFSGPRLRDALFEALNAHDQRSVLCFQLALNAVVTSASLPVRINLDAIIRILGLPRRNSEQRSSARRTIWTWLKNFASMLVIGQRRGEYLNVKGLRCEDELIRIEAFTCLPDGTNRR